MTDSKTDNYRHETVAIGFEIKEQVLNTTTHKYDTSDYIWVGGDGKVIPKDEYTIENGYMVWNPKEEQVKVEQSNDWIVDTFI